MNFTVEKPYRGGRAYGHATAVCAAGHEECADRKGGLCSQRMLAHCPSCGNKATLFQRVPFGQLVCGTCHDRLAASVSGETS